MNAFTIWTEPLASSFKQIPGRFYIYDWERWIATGHHKDQWCSFNILCVVGDEFAHTYNPARYD